MACDGSRLALEVNKGVGRLKAHKHDRFCVRPRSQDDQARCPRHDGRVAFIPAASARLNSHREIPGAVHGVSYANRASISIRKGRSSAFAPVCRAPLSVCARSTLPQPQCWVPEFSIRSAYWRERLGGNRRCRPNVKYAGRTEEARRICRV